MTQPKKLIEVAMPIKEISSESVRDKSIRHGHISTLHLWWARRPLPVCRAVVFASLVPDPTDENCPQAFRDAVKTLLKEHNGMDAYKPYDNIPYTAVVDPMEDNLRNRLLMFIGKFSDTYIQKGESTAAKDKLSNASLIKWDNKNDEEIIGKARKLIWVAHNAGGNSPQMNTDKHRLEKEKNISVHLCSSVDNNSAAELLADFDKHYKAIKDAENALYMTADRHLESDDVRQKEANLKDAIEAFLDKMPRVFDPFAGGGAIPLEASRLGCRSFGNDINPVAHIIQKGSLEFPQKYGKPIVYSRGEFIKRYGEDELKRVSEENSLYAGGDKVKIENRLSFDVEFYARELLKRAEAEIGHFYPADDKGKKPIAYYWARVGTCSNPSCRAEVPLLKGFYLVNTANKQFHLKPIIEGNKISFELKKGNLVEESWMTSRALICPCCKSSTATTEIKRQANEEGLKEELIAVIEDSDRGKTYRMPTKYEKQISKIDENLLDSKLIPNETMLKIPDLVSGRGWGIDKWSDLFSPRQLLAMQTLVQKLNEIKSEIDIDSDYGKSVITYLGILIDKLVTVNTSFGRWNVGRETLEHPFSKQAMPMMFDFPESNLFCDSTGSALNHLEWLKRYFEGESYNPFSTELRNASSGDKEQFESKFLTAAITDPPYYDAIAYADLSDFFYVWLKRTLGDVYPTNFATPQTPKSEECTALKHHHSNSKEEAKNHFENKLTEILTAIEHQTSKIVSIMFAHQSTEAWTALCNAILRAGMNLTGSWSIDTEMATRSSGLAGAVLDSSVTVCCSILLKKIDFGDYQEVKAAIEKKVEAEVAELYALGFRGADLLTACFGKAVGEFGKYERVEKASGDEVTVAELLEMTRESAFNALLKGFKGDDFTKFYIGWLELYGFTESDFDDAAKFSRVGLSINVADLFTHDIFIKNGNKQSLAGAVHRNEKIKRLGENADASLIDQAHCAMRLYKGNRRDLLHYIGKVAAQPDSTFWRVLTSLDELLPKGIDDQKQVAGLLENKDNLIRESQSARESAEQQGLFN